MTPTKWRSLTTAALALSLAFLFLTLVLPEVRSPQTATYSGPTTSYHNSTTVLSGYFLPPINKGDLIQVSVSNFSRHSVVISLFPASPGNFAPVGPLLLQEIPDGTNFASTLESTGTQSYGLFVVSYNRTTFSLRIQSNWSPFYVLHTYVVPAVFLVIATGAAAYYYIYAEKRWRSEQRAVRAATARKASGDAVPPGGTSS